MLLLVNTKQNKSNAWLQLQFNQHKGTLLASYLHFHADACLKRTWLILKHGFNYDWATVSLVDFSESPVNPTLEQAGFIQLNSVLFFPPMFLNLFKKSQTFSFFPPELPFHFLLITLSCFANVCFLMIIFFQLVFFSKPPR